MTISNLRIVVNFGKFSVIEGESMLKSQWWIDGEDDLRTTDEILMIPLCRYGNS